MAGEYERKLARILDRQGYHIMRAPSSGGGTKRSLPDLFFSRGPPPVCVELKTTGENVAYYTPGEVEALTEFGDAFGALPRLCARFKGDTTYYCYRAADARRTDSGKYAVDRDVAACMEITP